MNELNFTEHRQCSFMKREFTSIQVSNIRATLKGKCHGNIKTYGEIYVAIHPFIHKRLSRKITTQSRPKNRKRKICRIFPSS